MHAYSQSISTMWLVNVPISAVGLLLVLFIRGYTLKRTIVRGGEKKLEDVEKGEQATVEGDLQVMDSESLEKRPVTREDTTERTRAESADDISQEKTEA